MIEVEARIDHAQGANALREWLRAGGDPERAFDRSENFFDGGSLLIMPAWGGGYGGVKSLTVRDVGRPAQGRPRIQGTYVLFDSETMAPLAAFDGAALTALRTPSVTMLGLRELARRRGVVPRRIAVIGTGAQAAGHIRAVRRVFPAAQVAVRGRSESSLARLRVEVGEDLSALAPLDLREADSVITLTSSAEPVLDVDEIGADAIVAAVGAHGPAMREIGAALVERAVAVLVESRRAAFAEAGELLQVKSAARWGEDPRVLTLNEIVRDQGVVPDSGVLLFESVGCGWEDLAVAAAAHRAEQAVVR